MRAEDAGNRQDLVVVLLACFVRRLLTEAGGGAPGSSEFEQMRKSLPVSALSGSEAFSFPRPFIPPLRLCIDCVGLRASAFEASFGCTRCCC